MLQVKQRKKLFLKKNEYLYLNFTLWQRKQSQRLFLIIFLQKKNNLICSKNFSNSDITFIYRNRISKSL